jgi:hypothetical protein
MPKMTPRRRSEARTIRAAVVALAACLIAGLAHAQVSSDAPAEPQPSTLVAAYLFAPSIRGHAALGPTKVSLDVSRRDLLGGVRSGFMGYTRHHVRDNFVYAEVISLGFAQSSFGPFFDQAVNVKLGFFELGAGRTFVLRAPSTRATLYAGLRHFDLRLRIEGPLVFEAASERGVDATVGTSLEGPIGGAWHYALKGDVAGFSFSRRSYGSAAALLCYDLGPQAQLFGGWRTAHFRSRPGPSGLALDLSGQGPQAGLLYRF